MKKYLLLFCCCFSLIFAFGQEKQINPELLNEQWPSRWISHPDGPQRDYGVFHFRKVFKLSTVPKDFVIHVSADNRYRLFVNGKAVSAGPARGDLYNWYYETINIAPYLIAGDNIIAAKVWNMGIHAPVAQVSNQTALVVQGDTKEASVVNTNSSWKVLRDAAYTPCSTDNGPRLRAYMVVGPGDQVQGDLYPWGWESLQLMMGTG